MRGGKLDVEPESILDGLESTFSRLLVPSALSFSDLSLNGRMNDRRRVHGILPGGQEA
jgi:hypothetical protein